MELAMCTVGSAVIWHGLCCNSPGCFKISVRGKDGLTSF